MDYNFRKSRHGSLLCVMRFYTYFETLTKCQQDQRKSTIPYFVRISQAIAQLYFSTHNLKYKCAFVAC